MGSNHFDLSAQEFWDALTIRYCKLLLNLPPACDGYGAPSSLNHYLIVKEVTLFSSVTIKSGILLVTGRHWLGSKYDMKLC